MAGFMKQIAGTKHARRIDQHTAIFQQDAGQKTVARPACHPNRNADAVQESQDGRKMFRVVQGGSGVRRDDHQAFGDELVQKGQNIRGNPLRRRIKFGGERGG